MKTLSERSADILVVLPTLGQRMPFLARALESVRAQSQEVHLVVVVPSTAIEARKLAESFGATVVDDPGRGMATAINAGLRASTGQRYYMWLGDDDAYMAGGLAELSSLLDDSPRTVVAYGGCQYVNEDGEVVWVSRAGRLARWILPFGPNLIPHPAAMIRLDALQAVGGYREDLSMAMDLDVFLTLRKKGEFRSSKKLVSSFGWHRASLTVANRNASASEARQVKRSHLSPWIRGIEPLWEYPVQWLSRIAARSINHRG